MSIFDKKISIYDGVGDNVGTIATLGAFLNSRRHVEDIKRLRACTDAEEKKRIKLSLPQATISGIFSPTRKAENLQAHSGLICLDFDAKDNMTCPCWNDFKLIMAQLPFVLYCSKSVSGNGYFIIIRIECPQYHAQYFESLRRVFLKSGVFIDTSAKDVCRLRCMTYDDSPYINEFASVYKCRYKEPRPTIRIHYCCYGDAAKVDAAVKIIERQHLDIVNSYEDWTKAAMALSNLGERGRGLFHIVSRQGDDRYNYAECDKKFTNAMRTCKSVGLGSFFHLCEVNGIKTNLL
jgi:hypothetical protein